MTTALLSYTTSGDTINTTTSRGRLAYLSPTIVEAILNGQFPAHLTMTRLIAPFPMEWGRQREHFFSWGRNGKGG